MQITFVGHACFQIQTGGFKIITDPYSSQIGYSPVNLGADIVTLSHDNPKWHSCLDDVRGDFQVVNGLEIVGETLRAGAISFEAIEVFENLPDDGPNAMLKITAEKTRILHMGDVGHALDDATREKCGEIDVLLAPTGGAPTISLPDLLEFIEKLAPKIVIPMHFGVPNLAMNALPLEAVAALVDFMGDFQKRHG